MVLQSVHGAAAGIPIESEHGMDEMVAGRPSTNAIAIRGAAATVVCGAATLFDEKGTLTKDATREFLDKYLQAFAQWIERNPSK